MDRLYPRQGAIFETPMSPRRKEPFTPDSSRHFVRYFLSMPPILTVGQPCNSPLADYPVQYCMAHRTEILDAAVCHAAACASASSARTRKHNKIVRTLVVCLVARREPPTSSLLRNEFSPDECRPFSPANRQWNTSAPSPSCVQRLPNSRPQEVTWRGRKPSYNALQNECPVDPSDLKGHEVSGEARWMCRLSARRPPPTRRQRLHSSQRNDRWRCRPHPLAKP